jgi:hypothetical protein
MRYIPYGYRMVNGKFETNPDESAVVTGIFISYIEGKSFGIIAKLLCDCEVQFATGKKDWNKNRVKRILEDTRYMGEGDYPLIIEKDIYEKVQDIKKQKSCSGNRSGFRLPCSVICGNCSSRMIRVHNARLKVSEAWKCANPECAHRVATCDQDVKQSIITILNKLIRNPLLFRSNDPQDTALESERAPEMLRLQREIDNMLCAVDIDKERLKNLIYSLSVERYKSMDNTPYISEMLRTEFEKSDPLFSFNEMIFSKTVKNIKFGSDGELRLVLKNGVEIGRSNRNEDIRDYRNERENRKINTA